MGMTVVLYGGLYAVALIWCWLAGRALPFIGMPAQRSIEVGILAGLAVAAFGVISSRLAVRWIEAVRKLAQRFRDLVGPLSRREILLIAACSSLGEEAFFRGAVQPAFGIVVASLVFGCLHAPVERVFWIWTIWAVGMGFVLGGLALWEGGLVAPVVAHFGINWLNLTHICSLPTGEDAGLPIGDGVVVSNDGGGDDAVSSA